MFEWKTVIVSVVLCACAGYVGTYPSGAPQETCHDMVPHHGDLLPQGSQSPFYVLPSVLKISSGNKLRLMLASEQNVSFAGFMLQARSLESQEEPLGTFTTLPDMAKALTCGSGIKNTATHKSNTPKKSLEFEWEAPADYEGRVIFNATFVQNGATFWVGVPSDNVQVVKRSVPNNSRPSIGISTTKSPIRISTVPSYTLEPETKAKQQVDPVYDGCGSTKLCFGYPDGCIKSQTCDYHANVVVRGDTYIFTLFGTTTSKGAPKFVALGLSEDEKMSDDSVMECIVNDDNQIEAHMSYNIKGEYGNKRLPELASAIHLVNSSTANGDILCTFTRDPITTVEGKIYDLVKDKYVLLIAGGTSLKENGVGYHVESKLAASEAVSLSDTSEIGGRSNILYRLHGAFMVIAWIGCASTGILLARYFKQTWVGSQICGKDQWFAWHRIIMATAWTLTCAAFIIIFVQIQGWYGETSNPHGIIGCITMVLAFVQPFMAALRPAPDSPKRPIFNWSHWLVGNLAHILAIVTIFFAVKLAKAELPEWTDWVLVSYVTFHVFMHLIFSITGCISDKQWEKRVNDFPMQDMSSSRSVLHAMDRKRDAPHSCLRKFLLAIYLLVIIALTIFLIIIVVMAPIEEHWAFKKVKSLIFSQE